MESRADDDSLFDLFGDALPLGGWLPDETLFSLSSRYHRTTANYRPSTTCRALFGHARIGAAHDLPSNIDEFVARTRGRLGVATEIIRHRTVLPYFLAFKSQQVSTDAYAAMRGAGIAHLKFRLGLAASRFRCHLPLKACRQCMKSDADRLRIAYWRRRHQFPGVWLCPEHGVELWECNLKANGADRFAWVLPDEAHLQPRLFECSNGSDLYMKLRALGEAAIALGERNDEQQFDLARLSICHQERLIQGGLASRNGRLKLAALAQSYLDYVKGLAVVPELNALPHDMDTARAQVTRLLYQPQDAGHPLRELLLAVWLHGTWADFLLHYEASAAVATCQGVLDFRVRGKSETDSRKATAIRAVREDGKSATATARALGVDVSTVIAWLAQKGIGTNRRPKLLRKSSLARLLRLLSAGVDKRTAASRIGVSETTVTRILRTEVGLREQWLVARQNAERDRNRTAWSQVLKLNRLTPVRALRAVVPATYAWLYRNDREWLKISIASREIRRSANRPRIDWDTRDISLAEALRRTALNLSTADPSARVTIVSLCQALPDLKPKLGQLDHLPLTALALAEVANRRRVPDKS